MSNMQTASNTAPHIFTFFFQNSSGLPNMTLTKIFKQTNHDHKPDKADLKRPSTMKTEQNTATSSPIENGLEQKEPTPVTKRRSSLRAVRTIMKHAPKATGSPDVSSDKAAPPSTLARRRVKRSVLLRSTSTQSSSSTLCSYDNEGIEEDEDEEEDPILSLVGNRKRRIRRPCLVGLPQIQIGAIVGESSIIAKTAHCTDSTEPAVVTKALQSSEQTNDMLIGVTGFGLAKAEVPKTKLMIVKDIMYCARIILFPLRILYRKKPDIVEYKLSKGRLV